MRALIAIAFVAGGVIGYFAGNAIKRYVDGKYNDVPFKYDTYKDLRRKEKAESAMEEYSQTSEEVEENKEAVVLESPKCTMITIKKFSAANEEEWKKIYLNLIPDTDTLVDENGVSYDDPHLFDPIMAEVIESVKKLGAAYVKNEKDKTLYEVAFES